MPRKPLAAALLLLCMTVTPAVIATEPPLGGPQYDALVRLVVEDAENFEYRLQAPRVIGGMDYALAVLVYSNPTIIDGHERTGPLIDMEVRGQQIVGWFSVPEESRQPRVWAVIYYGNLGSDEPWLRTYSLVIDYPEE